VRSLGRILEEYREEERSDYLALRSVLPISLLIEQSYSLLNKICYSCIERITDYSFNFNSHFYLIHIL